MDRTLLSFVEALRQGGVRVSPAEAMDAMRLVQRLGVADRALLKYGLGSALAKSEEEKPAFEDVFERFFAAANTKRQGSGKAASTPQGLLGELEADDTAALARRLQQAAGDIGLEDIWIFTQKGLFLQRLLDAIGVRELDEAIEKAVDPEEKKRLLALRARLFQEAEEAVARALSLFSPGRLKAMRDQALKSKKLSDIEEKDLLRLRAAVREMARRLKDRHRLRKKRKVSGKLDVRRTLRANMGHDGVLFNLHFREKRKERGRVVALCDVSRSVARYVRFLLLFLYELKDVIPHLRIIVFASNAVEATDLFEAHPVEEALALVPKRAWGPTDYGCLWRQMASDYATALRPDTTLLVLGDGRSNHLPPETSLMRQVARRCKRVLWLNPEPRALWGYGDSEILRYRPHLHLLQECGTLTQLERGVAGLLATS